MEWIDYIVIIFLLFVLLGLSYSKSSKDQELEELGSYLQEGFQNEKANVNVYLFYSMLTKIPGKKCRENYKLFKENRRYLLVWNKFKEYMSASHPNVNLEAINIDEYPDYLQEYSIDSTPTIIIDNGENVIYLNNENVPTIQELVNFYENSRTQIVKDLGQYDDAIVYIYLPNCRDCKNFLPEWVKFKKQLKQTYPDLDVFEVNLAKHPSYKKYTYKFSPSVYPLVLTKILGKISVSDIVELYGSFTSENIFNLVDETIFNTPPNAAAAEEIYDVTENEVDFETETDPETNTQFENEMIVDNMQALAEGEVQDGNYSANEPELSAEEQLDQLMNYDNSASVNPSQFFSGQYREGQQAASGTQSKIFNRTVNNQIPMSSFTLKNALPRLGMKTRNPRTQLESRTKKLIL